MATDPPPRLDYSDYPSIVIPLEATTGVGMHSHPQHQLTWVPDGVLTMEVGSCRWIVQRSRALWIPGDTPHAVIPNSSCEMLSLFFEPADCPQRWDLPTVVDATGLVGPLLRYLVGLPNEADAERGRANAVLWDLVKPLTVTTIPTILPTDPQARQVALAIKQDPADTRGLDEWAGRSARRSGRCRGGSGPRPV
ncbi:AraC family ligand binding domain-containing protein [Nocardia colli]|uniref:AraC family ligand binding domain-containing protein n=1 Tax=Nocardia colli TaxID=2545717 RepID=UPI0035DF1338